MLSGASSKARRILRVALRIHQGSAVHDTPHKKTGTKGSGKGIRFIFPFVGMDDAALAQGCLAKLDSIPSVVARIEEAGLPVVATLHDVLQNMGEIEVRLAYRNNRRNERRKQGSERTLRHKDRKFTDARAPHRHCRHRPIAPYRCHCKNVNFVSFFIQLNKFVHGRLTQPRVAFRPLVGWQATTTCNADRRLKCLGRGGACCRRF